MYNIALINDISGIGKCSLTASIPVFAYFEIEPNPIITAVLSNQTGFKDFSFFDFTPHMKEYMDVWEKEKRYFEYIYTGFLGSIKQIDIIKDFLLKNENAFIIVDPIMGDNGVVYSTYSKEMCLKMKELIKISSLITPNITEAKILTDREVDKEVDLKEAEIILRELGELGPKIIVLTGIIKNGEIINMAYDKEKDKIYKVSEKYYPYSFSGTGDLFTSILTSLIIKEVALEKALEISSKFIREAIEDTIKEKFDTKEGIKFYKALKGVNIGE
ncbi:MAG: pyridoxamine kinase [Clostridium sp.]|uniref:pyridoxamine kinase n=1 Tax=Clostridium sp. TaxID=1506 RepID=UPI003EE5CB79